MIYPSAQAALAGLLAPSGEPTRADILDAIASDRAAFTREAAETLGVTRRTIQRYLSTSAQRRAPSQAFLNLAARRFGPRIATSRAAQRIAELARAGIRIRVAASIKVSRVLKFHVMPAERGGRASYVPLGGRQIAPILRRYNAGDTDGAGDALLARFFENYGLAGDTEVGEVEWVDVP